MTSPRSIPATYPCARGVDRSTGCCVFSDITDKYRELITFLRNIQFRSSSAKSRREFYDWLTATIRIDGVTKVERDTSAGIRLSYNGVTTQLEGLRQGMLLELGFDDATPNSPKDMSSWAYDAAAGKVDITDNRAKGIICYDPGYTFVEKLQTISTKFRRQQESGESPVGFIRHY
jgi:hypothetical protein